jgi:hypothetical protein
MTLGIQKLQGGVPFDVALPNFNSAGIRKPANRMGYVTLPLSGQAGPLQNEPGPIFRGGTGSTGSWTQGGHPFVISFWIRIPNGGGGNVISLYNHGYLSGMNVNYNDRFDIAVTETQISMSDNLNNSQNIGFENTRSIGFSKNYNINQQNAGWHHVFATLNRGDESGQLYVDGRNIGWDSITTSGSNAVSNAGEGYSAFSIGGRRIQTQVGVTTQVSYQSLAGEYDICHLGVWQGGGIGGGTNTFYPRFYDPGTSGRLDGTWTPPTGEPGQNYGTAFPYPMLWCEMDYSNSGANSIEGTAFAPLNDTYDITGPEANIFDQGSTLSWQAGVSGAGAISAAP